MLDKKFYKCFASSGKDHQVTFLIGPAEMFKLKRESFFSKLKCIQRCTYRTKIIKIINVIHMLDIYTYIYMYNILFIYYKYN